MNTPKPPIKETLAHYVNNVRKNAALIALVFVVAVYGFLGYQIFTLFQAQPNESQVSSQLQTVGIPKVDPTVISKINQLEDNSVSVQSLFDQARQNPFNE